MPKSQKRVQKSWSKDDVNLLIAMIKRDDLLRSDIATVLERSERSVTCKVLDLKKKGIVQTDDEAVPSQETINKRIDDLFKGENRQEPQQPQDPPQYSVIFNLLKNKPMSLGALCKRFDRSPETIRVWLDDMRVEGYNLVERENAMVSVQTTSRPQGEIELPNTLADEQGMVVSLGFASDIHAGSRYSQPTAYRRFCEIATNEYGVRTFLDPGDGTAGIFGYRGQEEDLIPAAIPHSKKESIQATQNQVWLHDLYTPKIDGIEHFKLGGNHDWKHVMTNGLDPTRMLCDRREDFHYCGYDVCDLPMTDRVRLRLWHPAGGIPYSRSYRIQKGMESEAFKTLQDAVVGMTTPAIPVLAVGHLHIAIFVPITPSVGAHVGCFEGQTNYLARKGLNPDIGGTIMRFLITDSGRIQRTEFTFIPFDEISEDWRNYDVPEHQPTDYDPEDMDALYEFKPGDESFVIEHPFSGLGPMGGEYVGGR